MLSFIRSSPAPRPSPLSTGERERTAAHADVARLKQANRFTILGVALVLAGYYWISSAGGVSPVPMYSHYYARLADSFERGQTHLLVMPAPGHLALPDPYDPVANRPFRGRVHDM